MNLQQAAPPRSSSNGFNRRKGEKEMGIRFDNKSQSGKSIFNKTGLPTGNKGGVDSPSRERLVYLTTCLIGHQVEVQVTDGSVYSGIFHATNAENDFGLILKMACVTNTGSSQGPKNMSDSANKVPSKTLIIPAKDLVQIVAKGVPVTKDVLTNEVQVEKQQDIMTDSLISRSRHVDLERELEPWVPDVDNIEIPELDNTFDRHWNWGWDQFETNAALFGVKSTFNEELYTTKLDRGPQMRELERQALRIAREIEGEDTQDLHLAETRLWQRDTRDRTILQPTPAAAIDMLPTVAYSDNPSTSFASKFVHTSLNKNRCSINRVLWTPTGRRLITGSHSGEFTLWNGQSFNFEMILQAHDQPIRSMVWSYNDNWMVTGDDGGSIKYWQNNMNNVKANKSAHKESVRDLSFCRTDLKFCSCSDDTTVKVWDFARCQEERSLSGHGWDVKSVDWHPTKSLLVSGGKDNLVKLWDAKSGKELCSFHGHKNTVLCVKWNQNGNWVLTASKDQIIKLYDIRAMKELQSFRGHRKDVTALAWHPFHEEYFVSGSFDGSIFHWLVGHETPQVEIQNAHDSCVWDLAWHPIGYLLCSGSSDNTTKFWCRNRPGDPARDKFNTGHNQGYNEQNPAVGRMAVNFAGSEPPTTPGPFGGMNRNEGTIPGIGIAMPLSLDTQSGDQKPSSMPMPLGGAPPLPPGPHPSLFANQHHHHHQQQQQQMTSLPSPNMHPTHMPLLPHPHLPRPPPHNMPMHPQMMGPPMQQGHFMGMNPMQQGPPSGGGNQMYSSGGNTFNRPQGAQMPPMPGLGPYQTGNPSGGGMGTVPPNFGMPSGLPPPLPPGPPPHGQTPQ